MASTLALFHNAANLFRMSLISLEPIFLDFNAYLTFQTVLLKELDDSSFIEQTIMLELSRSTLRLFLKFCQKHQAFNNYWALIAEKVIGSMRRRCFLGEYFEFNDFQSLLLNCLFNYFATIQSSGSHCKMFEPFHYWCLAHNSKGLVSCYKRVNRNARAEMANVTFEGVETIGVHQMKQVESC